MITARPTPNPLRSQLLRFSRKARAPRLRTMREFAEAEIIIPDGPFKGKRFRCDRQPYSRVWFDLVDSGLWRRRTATGPQQSGKTLHCYVTPTMYHLFEIGETVINGIPTLDMAGDKWREDIKPAIEASRYRELLPRNGPGSRGSGNFTAIKFRNGATLRFMTGGGDDKSRSAFTARVLVVTEADGLDEAGETSREGSKLAQLEGRTSAYDVYGQAIAYLECTVSIETGAIWQEHIKGTQSQLVLPCKGCGHWVSPERADLVGWQDADNEIEARDGARFACPDCGLLWSEEDRKAANLQARVIHKGQEIDEEGNIHGPLPPTETLGFRWSAVNNLFVSAGRVGQREYKAANSVNQDEAETETRQFVWAIPAIAPEQDLVDLTLEVLQDHVVETSRDDVPRETESITVGVDLGKRFGHWITPAWLEDGSGHVVDYGEFQILSHEFGEKQATLAALREFDETIVQPGFGSQGRVPDHVWIDSGWEKSQEAVYAFCEEMNEKYPERENLYRPMKGYGTGQHKAPRYSRPKKTGAQVRFIGDNYHLAKIPKWPVQLVEISSDYWKSEALGRFATAADQPGTLTIFGGTLSEHLFLFKHLLAEKEIQEWVDGKGWVRKWIPVSKNNHYLDACYIAAAAGHYAGTRLIERPDDGAAAGEATSLSEWAAAARGRR